MEFSRRNFLKLAFAVTSASLTGGKMTAYTFYDDFDGPAGSAPDPAKWAYDIGGGGWGNGQLQTYTPSLNNAYLDGNSNLVISATTDGNGNYWSARLKTLGIFTQIGGSFEARIKFQAQQGVWPAFWLLGRNIPTVGWPQCGEVDIFEDFGNGRVQSAVHAPNGKATFSQAFAFAPDPDWHTYRATFDEEGITFFRDEYEYGHAPMTFCPSPAWVFGPQEPNNGGMYIILNVAVGGGAGATTVGDPQPGTVFPATMLVDYVKAWQ